MKIKDIPINERPREKLLEYGSSNLSNDELLAIILKQGTKNKSVKEIGIDILKSVKDVNDLKNITFNQLISINGIGEAQALTLLAVLELGKRIYCNKKISIKVKFTNSKEIYEYMKYLLSNNDQEYFYCIYVNTKRELIERKLLFMGTINRSTVHPREIFKHAYLNSASGIICIHNHPSGDIRPSSEDIRLTSALCEIGLISGIPVLDHIIVGEDKYYSFFDDGKIINM